MDALIASAVPLNRRPSTSATRRKPRSTAHLTVPRSDGSKIDPSLHSILPTTRPPKAHQIGRFSEPTRPEASTSRIRDKKLRSRVARTDIESKRAKKEREEVNEWLNSGVAGGLEVDEEEGESTWRIRQEDIGSAVGVGSASKSWDLKLDDMGSYMLDYTRNGR